MYRSLFRRDLFNEFDRLQRDLSGLLDTSPHIRGLGRGGYPALNVGVTPTAVEVYAFAPGMDPAKIDVNLDRGVLTIDGERSPSVVESDGKSGSTASTASTASPASNSFTLHSNERFAGRFRRVVSLPDDIDPGAVSAEYRDGVLRISVKRREAAQPRRIEVH